MLIDRRQLWWQYFNACVVADATVLDFRFVFSSLILVDFFILFQNVGGQGSSGRIEKQCSSNWYATFGRSIFKYQTHTC